MITLGMCKGYISYSPIIKVFNSFDKNFTQEAMTAADMVLTSVKITTKK